MGSPVVPLRSTSKMNFKFLLAVFVVAVALMPTAHSQWPNRGNLAAQLLAASCRFGICLTTTSPDSPGCPTGWVKQFGRCYQFSTQEKNWDEAKEHCRSNEAQLVSVGSPEEHDYIFQNINEWVWTGGYYEHGAETWAWSDGTPWNYQYWFDKQPSADSAPLGPFWQASHNYLSRYPRKMKIR